MGGGDEQAQQNQISDRQLHRGAGFLRRTAVPSAESITAQLQRAVYLGDVTAIEAITILQKDTEMANIQVDPQLEFQQFAALEDLQKQSTAMGMSAQDKADLFDVGLREKDAQKQGRTIIGASFGQRGIGGSGLEQQAQLEALQSPYDPGTASRMDVARGASARRMGAQVAAGGLAGGLRGQAFGEDASVATAQDLINRFNTEATNVTRMSNVEDARAAALRNIEERQRISNLNTSIGQREEMGRVAGVQQAFENRLGKAQDISGLYTQGAIGQAQATQPQPDLGGALAGAGATLLSEFGPKAWDTWQQSKKPKT